MIEKEQADMDLITIRELYKHKEEYLDKTVTIGGWVRSIQGIRIYCSK